jgi:hypothetical protein
MNKFLVFVCFIASISLLLTGCGPSLEQQSTLVAVSIFSTMTAEATSKVSAMPLPPTGSPTETSIPIPTDTPTDTPTLVPSPTSTPNQTATALSQIFEAATVQAGWKPALYDTFGDNVFGWCNDISVVTSDDGAKSRFFFDNGVYHMTYTAGDKYPQTWCAPYGTFYNFQLSVLSKILYGDPETAYGVVFRVYQQSFKGLIRSLSTLQMNIGLIPEIPMEIGLSCRIGQGVVI